METQFTFNDWYNNSIGRISVPKASHFISKNYVIGLIFIFACIFIFPLNKLHAQENGRSGRLSTSEISVDQIKKECSYFAGDSLDGFDLDETIAIAVNSYSSYIELQSYLFQKEAGFVRAKYQIAHLPYESASTQNPSYQLKKLNGGCSNVDFEDGDFNGWTGGKGYNALSTDPLTIFNTGIFTLGADSPQKSCSYHTMITNASGNDYYGNFPALCPNGGTYSVRLGGDNVNYYNGTDCNNLYTCSYPGPANPHHAAGEVLEQTFTVSASNTLFTFYYAADLNDGGHAPGEQAYFAIQVYDSTGSPINCFSHRIELVAGAVPPGGFLSANGNCNYSSNSQDYHVYSIPWQADSYNLSGYIGQSLTVKFTAAGCTLGGHFGIGYFDAKCGPAEITTSNATPCSGQSVVLTAPPSASGMYSWTGPGIVGPNNTQSITVNVTGTYSVTVGTGVCSYPLSILINFNPSINVTANPTTICSGQSSTLTATGANTYVWMPGNLTGSSVIVTPASTTIYTLTGTSGACSESSTVTVNVNLTPTITAVASPSIICIGATSTLSASGASTYNWSGFGSTNPISLTPLSTTTYTVTGTAANGCTSSNTTTVTVNPLPGVTVSGTPSTLCYGSNTGIATANASGGTGPYNYNWSNGAITQTINNLVAGIYSVTVTDIKACNATSSKIITQPTQLISGISASTNVSCFGGNNGTSSVIANGGTLPYSYHWATGSNTSAVNSLIAGNYSVTTTDNNGCTSTAMAIITQPAQLISGVTSSVNVSCFGGNNGTATATANGGTSPYYYHWSNGCALSTVTNLSAGNYSVTATDNNGCTSTISVAINQSTLLNSVVSPYTNVSCFSGNNGAATATVNGGAAPYLYNWSNGANTAVVTGLVAGNYTVTVTDNYGCTSIASVIITQPTIIVSNLSSSTNVSCFGGNNGTISLAINGGTSPYTFNWSNGANTNNITGLSAGNYTGTVTDNNGCTTTTSVVITQPILLTSNITTSNNISCFGGNNGSATVSVIGGIPPYAYNWSNGGNTATQNNLLAGNYLVTVTDYMGCTSSASIILNQPMQLATNISASSNVTCFGLNNGTATISANGGSVPYNYSWSNGLNTASISGLAAGVYTITTTDNNNCSVVSSVVITQPTLLTSGVTQSTNVSCFGGTNGSAGITANGGMAPYSYFWSNGGNSINTSGLSAGTYYVTTTDNSGCQAVASVIITQPGMLTTTVSAISNASCFGGNNGAAVVMNNGGTAPYTIIWSNGANTNIITGLSAGIYSVTTADSHGCNATASINITQPALLTSSISSFTNVSCYGGTNGNATITALGGAAPYTYIWSNGSITAANNNMAAGSYTVTITDNNGCSANNTTFISQPSQLVMNTAVLSNVSCYAGNNGSAIVTTNGGNAPYSYFWSNGNNSAMANGLIAGNYIITVSDFNGCTATTSLTLTQPLVMNSVVSTTNASCVGISDGSASITVNGGIFPYAYTWSNGLHSSVINGLSAGNYSVVINDNNGCYAYASVAISETPPVIPNFSIATSFCFGSPVPYLPGTSTNGIFGLWNPPAINNTASGTYTFTPTPGQCAAIATLHININPIPTISASSYPPTICTGHSSVLSASGASIYSWQPGNLSGPTVNVMPIAATVYTVTGTSVYGCSDKSYTGVDLAPEIPVYFTANPKKGCSPLPVEYNLISTGLIDTNSLQWNFGDPLTSSDFSNSTAPHYTYTDQGNFIVSINALSIYGCPASGYDTITVWPNPIADFVTHPEIGQSDDPRITFYDQSTGATAWNWNFGNPLSGTDNFSSQQFPMHYFDDPGQYTVQLIVSNDFNCLDTVVKSLKMLESFAFFVPNAFTPNGDGNNEGFKGKGVGIDESRFEMRIFDRWGKEIFMTKDYNESWDGKTGVRDVLSEQTIYVWQVNVADKTGMQHNLNGMVALIR